MLMVYCLMLLRLFVKVSVIISRFVVHVQYLEVCKHLDG